MAKEMRSVLIVSAVFLVFAIVAAYFVNDIQTEVTAKEEEIRTMEAEIETLQKEADLHDGLVEELDSLKANFSQYVKILPSPEVATEERLMELLQEKCERAQFGASSFIVKPKSASVKKGKGGFQEIDVTMQAEATYEQFLRFLNSLERHESFLRVNYFGCTGQTSPKLDAEGNETWPLTISLNISTFRYEAN